ncbi:glycosyltransferase family 4 protein [Endozoicomonas sp. Mp262]|uniref:glycosyltransferase family 4 protein n=1 Tax=Endozoicomonas sp. Mp262 TaxID=2919499 RepID=UPI0021D8B1AB
MKTVWYISKYFEQKNKGSNGGRGWCLLYELVKRGYNATVITSDSNVLAETPVLDNSFKIDDVDGVQVVWLRTLKYTIAKSLLRVLSWFHFEWQLFKLDKKILNPPDVVVVSSISLLTILNGFLIKRKFKCSLVFEIRDIWPLTLVEEGGFSRRNPLIILLALVEKLGYKHADVIIGTMPNLLEHVNNILGYEKPVYCIPMGVDVNNYRSIISLEKGYKDTYLSSDKVKIVYAGTIGITNALDVFFEAAKHLEGNKDIEFIIVGDGPLRERYIKLYGNLNNLVFAPKVNKNSVQSVLNECDIVCFSAYPSKVWNYGQSLNKLIDYMSSGKPIIASYTGFKSMINESGCGSFVPAGDVLALVSEIKYYAALSGEERSAIGQKGKEWLFENRSYEKLACEFEDVIFNGQ